MTAFLLMNITVMLTAGILTYKIFRFKGIVDPLILLVVLALSQITATQLILGIAAGLTLRNAIFLNLAILLTVWFLCRKQKPRLAFTGFKTEFSALLSNKVAVLAAAAILGFGITKICVNLVNPPFGWDSLNYHFTFAVEWLKHANLNTPITICDDPSPTYYPLNGSLFFLWLTLPFKSVFLADLGQLPFFLLAFLAVFSIARKAGLEQRSAFFCAALFTLIPNYFKQLQIAYVDVMVAGLFLACLNFLFLLNEKFSLKNVLAYALAMGLLLGTKTLALPYSLLLNIPFIYLLCKDMRKAYLLIVFLTVICGLGGFSYLRNFFETGNPLYPLNINILGREFLRGVMDNSVYRARFTIHDYAIGKLLFHEGLGLQVIIFAFPAVFLTPLAGLIKDKRRTTLGFAYLACLPLLTYLIYQYFIPLANTRYLYPALAMAMISGFYLFKMLKIPQKLVNVFVALSILASMSELAKRQELIWGLMITCGLFFLLPVTIKFIKQGSRFTKLACLAASIFVLLSFIPIAGKYYQKNEFPNYLKMVKYSGFWPDATKAWAWLNKNTCAANIAYTGRPVPFPLYGSNFKNNVYYASVNKTDPAKLHYFPGSHYSWDSNSLNLHKNLGEPENYRGNADYKAWLDNLLKRDTDYLFVYSLHQTKEIAFPVEKEWADTHPEKFDPVFSNQSIRIYKIKK